MWKVTLKGIWSKKVRFLLTGIAVMLGVAFVSGTFVLTETISNTFNGLFNDIYQNTDAVVRGREEFRDRRRELDRGRLGRVDAAFVREALAEGSPGGGGLGVAGALRQDAGEARAGQRLAMPMPDAKDEPNNDRPECGHHPARAEDPRVSHAPTRPLLVVTNNEARTGPF